MIPTFNCADLLRATLESVLAQDPGVAEMQIEVVDDCSTVDDPEAVVAHTAGDRVSFFRHPANVGIGRNFTACLKRSRGRWVHVLHGDDVVYPGLYAKAGSVLAHRPDVDAVIVGALDVDEGGTVVRAYPPIRPCAGVLDDFEQSIYSWNPIRAPALIARRETYEGIGGFRPELRYCADWDMWKRMAADHRLYYEPEVLVGYRVHGRSDTDRLGHSVPQLREMIDSVVIGHRYVPDGRTRAWTREFYATTRRWAWDRLVAPPGGLGARDAAGYAAVVAETVLREQGDRLRARHGRRRRS
jgi:glycosyltransferase involved in cell wall biosynthesis